MSVPTPAPFREIETPLAIEKLKECRVPSKCFGLLVAHIEEIRLQTGCNVCFQPVPGSSDWSVTLTGGSDEAKYATFDLIEAKVTTISLSLEHAKYEEALSSQRPQSEPAVVDPPLSALPVALSARPVIGVNPATPVPATSPPTHTHRCLVGPSEGWQDQLEVLTAPEPGMKRVAYTEMPGVPASVVWALRDATDIEERTGAEVHLQEPEPGKEAGGWTVILLGSGEAQVAALDLVGDRLQMAEDMTEPQAIGLPG